MITDDVDTEEPVREGEQNEAPKQKKSQRRSFEKVRRNLTDEELLSTGVQKMMLDELDRLEGGEAELRSTAKSLSETTTALAVANEKLKQRHAFDVLSTGTVAVGSLIFGAAFSINDNNKLFGILIVFSVVLVGVGIAAKVVRS